ncbi:MAG: hypothetical protein EBW68_05095 [Actinobacteria bacterium]|nr:hypothetical protein [Actinomycetota bacterium]
MMKHKSRGSLSAVVICIAFACMSLAGLAFDGGRVVSSYMAMSDAAQNAARLGGQQLVGIREGNPHIDRELATSAMRTYLAARTLSGKFDIQETRATVEISQKIPMRILGIIGISDRTIRVSRSADVVDG